MAKNKLELTWVGKDERPRLEPRALIEGGIPRIEREGRAYEPDFIAERSQGMFLCEVKADNAMNDLDVLAKADAAARWCRFATEHANGATAKPWTYLLVKESRVDAGRTFSNVVTEHTYRDERNDQP